MAKNKTVEENSVPVDVVVNVKATGTLQEEIEKELEQDEPDKQHAIASLKED